LAAGLSSQLFSEVGELGSYVSPSRSFLFLASEERAFFLPASGLDILPTNNIYSFTPNHSTINGHIQPQFSQLSRNNFGDKSIKLLCDIKPFMPPTQVHNQYVIYQMAKRFQ
jgi:hypothetical protein